MDKSLVEKPLISRRDYRKPKSGILISIAPSLKRNPISYGLSMLSSINFSPAQKNNSRD
jgi:hypothetical protein